MQTVIFESKLSSLFSSLTLRHFSLQEKLSFRATPNHCFDIVLPLNGAIGFATDSVALPLQTAALLGMHAEPIRFNFADQAAGLHIRLEPHQLYHFVEMPLRELSSQALDLASIWGTTAGHLQENVQAAKGFAAKISLLEEFFSHRYRNRDTRATQYITKLVKSPTTELSVKGLGETTQLSERQLERLFAEQVGIPPRTYLKISRFQRVVSLFTQRQLLDARPALLPLALEAGYYDQSHFIRDCKQLTGLTPEAYFSTVDPLLSGSYNT